MSPEEAKLLRDLPEREAAMCWWLMENLDARLVEGPTRQDLEDTIKGGADRYQGPPVPRVSPPAADATDRVSTRGETLF